MLIQVEAAGHVYAPGTPLARTAVRGVSLSIAPGERVGIVGATGSGKSTLVQLLAGLLVPTSGRVLLDGVEAHARSRAARDCRRRIGLALQYPEDQIFEPTVFKEVAFGPRNLRLAEAEIGIRVRWALDLVGLDRAFETRAPLALSGGEMRRVALASILALRPDVLILDEPTAGLDPQGRRGLLARVLAWQQDTGATLITISHDLDEVARLAGRLVLLADGQVAWDGPAAEVLADGPRLRSVGLAPPPGVALLEALAAAGWDVRTSHLLPDDVAAEIARVWRVRAGVAEVDGP